MRTILLTLAALVAASLALGWWLARPEMLAASELDGITGNAERGAELTTQAGCASCHLAPGAEDDAQVLAGGEAFETPFGTLYAPNISPSPQGIGDWSDTQIVNALVHGVSADGAHLYPALPYTSYENANLQDLADITAHLRTRPSSDAPSKPNEMPFPYNIRASLGGWKLLYADRGWVVETGSDETLERGRYLVEALFHCGQCHTPRTALGGMDRSAWMQGAPNPSGRGRIPGIAPGQLDWSDTDIAAYLRTGLTPEYDSAGGKMAAVVRNLSTLPEGDIDAIVTYLGAVTPADEANDQ